MPTIPSADGRVGLTDTDFSVVIREGGMNGDDVPITSNILGKQSEV
jgi:hypothetical protein